MHQTEHAQNMTNRFRELMEESGDSIPVQHYDELQLIIEAGLDAALIDTMAKISKKLSELAHDIQHNAEFFN